MAGEDDCKDVSKICSDLIDKVPTICSDESSVMTRFCQASCNKCDVVVADNDIQKLECKDFSDNCAMKNLFDQKLGRANEECHLDPTVRFLKKEDLTPTQVRKLRYQGFCRKTCGLCEDIIFEKIWNLYFRTNEMHLWLHPLQETKRFITSYS